MTRKMKDSGVEWIGEIPEDWKISKYKYFAKSGMGETILGENLCEGGKIPVYSATQGNGIFGYVNESSIKLANGDLVIPARGNSIGNVTFIKDELATCTQTTIYSNLININNKYMYYCCLGLKNKWFEFDNTAIPQVTVKQIQNNILPLPTKIEQIKISNWLDIKCSKIDKTIEIESQVIEKLKEYKQSVITEAVTKGLNPDVSMKDSGVEWIGEIPKHWSIRRLRYLGNCQNGISKSSEYFGKGYPFVSYGDVYRNMELPEVVNGLVESTESDRKTYSVEQDDIFFTRTSETIEEIGLTCICTKTIENATFAGFLIRVRPTNKESLNMMYSKYYFSSNMHRRFFVKEMNLVTRASLSQELLKKLPVLLPPIEEQQEIADYLDKKCSAIDKLISNKEKVIEKLTEYKKSLIYECVTGKREVQ